MYTRDFDDLAHLMNIADAFLSPASAHLLHRKPSAVAYRLGADASPTKAAAEGTPSVSIKRRRLAEPTFDWEAAEGGVTLHAATPGLKKEDLSIKIVDEGAQRYLLVSGGTKDPAAGDQQPADAPVASPDKAPADKPADTPTNHKLQPHADTQRYYYAAFEHRMRIPSGITSDCLSAKYEDGLLTLHLALPQPKPPQSETITIA